MTYVMFYDSGSNFQPPFHFPFDETKPSLRCGWSSVLMFLFHSSNLLFFDNFITCRMKEDHPVLKMILPHLNHPCHLKNHGRWERIILRVCIHSFLEFLDPLNFLYILIWLPLGRKRRNVLCWTVSKNSNWSIEGLYVPCLGHSLYWCHCEVGFSTKGSYRFVTVSLLSLLDTRGTSYWGKCFCS